MGKLLYYAGITGSLISIAVYVDYPIFLVGILIEVLQATFMALFFGKIGVLGTRISKECSIYLSFGNAFLKGKSHSNSTWVSRERREQLAYFKQQANPSTTYKVLGPNKGNILNMCPGFVIHHVQFKKV